MRLSKKKSNIFVKYLPIVIILLSITIMIGSTFAYFTDRKDESSDLTFSKVELSSETTLGINGVLDSVIPGTKLVDGDVSFSKAIDSEAIYVRAKVSFTLPKEYENDVDMINLVKVLTKSSKFNIIETEQHGAVWSEKDGNYFYLLNNSDKTKLMRVDTVDTFVLSNEIIIPRELEQLEGHKQYMKSINFHIAFEAIQADNVSDVLNETKGTFNAIFPTSAQENKYSPTFDVIFTGADHESIFNIIKVEEGQTLFEPNSHPESGSAVFEGWYIDKALTIKFGFNTPITEDVILYPKFIMGNVLTIMNVAGDGVIKTILVGDGEVTVAPSSGELGGEYIVEGYYTEPTFENQFIFGTTINQSYTLYPKVLQTSEGLEFTPLYEEVATTSSNDLTPAETEPTSYSVARGTCEDTYIVIPEYYQGKPVTQITANGFKDYTTMTNVHLPSNIQTINTYAFSGCTALKSIDIGENVTTIGKYAFNNCTAVTILNYNAKSATNFTVNNYVFYKVGSKGSGVVLTIGENVESLPQYLFTPTSGSGAPMVTVINYNAININSMSGVNNNQVFTYMGQGYYYDGIIVNIGNKVEKIPAHLFNPYNGGNTPKLLEVRFEEGSVCKSIGDYVFYNCDSLIKIELPNSVTSIGSNTFQGCSGLTSFIIPNSVTWMGWYTFKECDNLKEVIISTGLNTIGQQVFYGCISLSNLIIPENITSIGASAFYNCGGLISLTIPKDMTTIDSQAFYGCSRLVEIINLSSINLSIGTTSNGYVAAYAYNVYSSAGTSYISKTEDGFIIHDDGVNVCLLGYEGTATDITLPASINGKEYNISNYAFSYCVNIKKVTIPDTAISIGSYAFYKCTGITTFNMGNGVTTIGTSAFYFNTAMTTLILSNTLQKIGNEAFSNCAKLKNIYIPSSVTSVGTKAFNSTSNAYILCEDSKDASAASGKGSSNVYYITTDDCSAFTFTKVTNKGDVNGTYSSGAYIRTGAEGSYVYYKKV